MNSPRILVTDCDHGFMDPEREVAAERGVDLRIADGDVEALAPELDSFAGLLTQYHQVTAEFLERVPNVKVVGRYGVGVDTIDLEAAEHAGVTVVNVPDFCTEEVADHAMALALTAMRRVAQLDRVWRRDPAGFAAAWDDRFDLLAGVERTRGRTFGLLGFGRTGRAVAERAAAFGFNVIAHDPFMADQQIADSGAEPAPLDAVLTSADVISLHMPASAGSKPVIDQAAIARMKDGVILVNTARGALIDEQAVVEGLRSRKIGVAALDVFREEPLPADHPLFGEEGAVLTPHIAFYSRTSVIDLKYRAMNNVIDALERAPSRP